MHRRRIAGGSARGSVCGSTKSVSAVSDLETTPGSLGTIAALSNGHPKHFRYQALDCQTHAGVLTGQCCQRTSPSLDDVTAVSLDMGQGAKLLVDHLAGNRHSGAKAPGGAFSARQVVGESLARLSKYRFELIRRQGICERVSKARQQGDVRAG